MVPDIVDNERTALLAVPNAPAHSIGLGDEQQPSPTSSGASTPTLKEKKFPWRFALTIYGLNVVTPLSFELIFPFINQMILENGVTNDPEKVGFYSGLIESIFALFSFASILPLTYLSDHLGRRPIILMSTVGLAVSITLFGVAKSYWFMIATRLIGGTLGGSIAATKVMLTEVIDKSQQGLAFAGFVTAYRMGQIIGQPMGGLLSHPADKFDSFNTPFWREYPFSLPCFIAAAFAVFAVSVGFFTLPETSVILRRKKNKKGYGSVSSVESGSPMRGKSQERPRPSVYSILTPDVTGALLSSAIMGFSSELVFALYPLFAFTPIESGGLSLNESQIGTQLGIRSCNNVLVIALYSPLERRLGTVRLYQLTMLAWPITFLCFPVLNLLARNGWEGTWTFQAAHAIFVTFWSFGCLGWTSASIIVNNAAPSAEALSVINGIGQMATTLPLAFAPAFITSLFAFSLKHEHYLNGNLVYVVMLVVGILGALHCLTIKEPTSDWRDELDDDDDDDDHFS